MRTEPEVWKNLGTTCKRCRNWAGIPGRPPWIWSLVGQQNEIKKDPGTFRFWHFCPLPLCVYAYMDSGNCATDVGIHMLKYMTMHYFFIIIKRQLWGKCSIKELDACMHSIWWSVWSASFKGPFSGEDISELNTSKASAVDYNTHMASSTLYGQVYICCNKLPNQGWLDFQTLQSHSCYNSKSKGSVFFLRRPLSRQGRPTGIRKTGSESSAPGAGVC